MSQQRRIQRGENQNEGALRGVYLRGNRWMWSLACSLPVSVVSPSEREQHMLRVCENMPLPCAREQACVLRTVLSEDYLQSAEAEFCLLAISMSQILCLSAFLFCRKAVKTSQHKLRASLVYYRSQVAASVERKTEKMEEEEEDVFPLIHILFS